jgi:hypothetical protein
MRSRTWCTRAYDDGDRIHAQSDPARPCRRPRRRECSAHRDQAPQGLADDSRSLDYALPESSACARLGRARNSCSRSAASAVAERIRSSSAMWPSVADTEYGSDHIPSCGGSSRRRSVMYHAFVLPGAAGVSRWWHRSEQLAGLRGYVVLDEDLVLGRDDLADGCEVPCSALGRSGEAQLAPDQPEHRSE